MIYLRSTLIVVAAIIFQHAASAPVHHPALGETVNIGLSDHTHEQNVHLGHAAALQQTHPDHPIHTSLAAVHGQRVTDLAGHQAAHTTAANAVNELNARDHAAAAAAHRAAATAHRSAGDTHSAVAAAAAANLGQHQQHNHNNAAVHHATAQQHNNIAAVHYATAHNHGIYAEAHSSNNAHRPASVPSHANAVASHHNAITSKNSVPASFHRP